MIERVGFDSGTITVEYELAPKMVIFSHDFAALRDDRGLLSDIAANLPAGYGYALFDYYDTDSSGQTILVKTFAEQLKRLRAVIKWLEEQKQVTQIDIVAHSLGCIVAAKLNPPTVRELIMLAPPTVIGEDLKNYTKSAGAIEKTGVWYVQRPDNVVITIPDSFFGEISRIDGEAELEELALLREYVIILPGSDEVLLDADYTELIVTSSVHVEAVDDTNHNFEGAGRADLLAMIRRYLQPEVAPTEPKPTEPKPA